GVKAQRAWPAALRAGHDPCSPTPLPQPRTAQAAVKRDTNCGLLKRSNWRWVSTQPRGSTIRLTLAGQSLWQWTWRALNGEPWSITEVGMAYRPMIGSAGQMNTARPRGRS